MAETQTRFARFVGRHEAAQPLLPAVRITNVVGFGKALDCRTLKLNDEGLLYFFYGKPSFKISKKHSIPTKILGDAAVCFVLDLSSLPEIHRAFALDTGAYHGKRYDNYLPNGLLLADFELPVGAQSLQQLVRAFFGDNERYYSGHAKADLTLDALDHASEVYANIIRSAVSSGLDERACSCELQFNQPIELLRECLITIIMPGLLYDDPEVKKFVTEVGIIPILYRFKRASPDERTEVVYEKLGDFYEQRKLL